MPGQSESKKIESSRTSATNSGEDDLPSTWIKTGKMRIGEPAVDQWPSKTWKESLLVIVVSRTREIPNFTTRSFRTSLGSIKPLNRNDRSYPSMVSISTNRVLEPSVSDSGRRKVADLTN